jgi:hypothetical protein
MNASAFSSAGRLRFRRLVDDVVPPLLAGRRLGSGGALSGRLLSEGYFSTELCLGTPPRRFELVVDTGSSVTSVPCRRCSTCGRHRCGRRGRFDERASSTAERASCASSRALRCESCARKHCTYRVSYMEGSRISGRVLRDAARFTALPSAARPPLAANSSRRATAGAVVRRRRPRTVSARVFFGCQSFESGKFRQQAADGILGLQSEDETTPSPYACAPPATRRSAAAPCAAVCAFSRAAVCAFPRAAFFLRGRLRVSRAAVSPRRRFAFRARPFARPARPFARPAPSRPAASSRSVAKRVT